MTQVGGSGLRASGAGLAAGLLLCAVTLRVMRSVLYGVSVYDVPTLAAVAGTLGLTILVAALAPTLRIARIDPVRTLREE